MNENTNEIWTWIIDEESIVLKSPEEEMYFNYDKNTSELKTEPSSQWINTYDGIPYSQNGKLSLIEAGKAFIKEKFPKKNIFFAFSTYNTDKEGNINRVNLDLPLIEPDTEIKINDIEKSIRNDYILDYFNDVKNPSFQKLHYPEKIAVIDDMITNIDWIGEYNDKTGKQTASLPLSYVKETIEHQDLNNRYSYFDMNNAGQYRHYSEVINEWKNRNPHINDKLIDKEHKDIDKRIEDNINYAIRKNLEGKIFVSDFNNEDFENENIKNHDESFRYMLLDRMKTDCDYYLGNGNKNKEKLWSGDETQQIKNMISLFRSFGVKGQPEWLPVEELNNYSRQLTGKNIDEIMKETVNEKEEKAFLDESASMVMANIMLKNKKIEPFFYGITHYGLRELQKENDLLRNNICENIEIVIKDNEINLCNSKDIQNIMNQMIEKWYIENHETKEAKKPNYIFKKEHLDTEIEEGKNHIVAYNENLGMWGICDKDKKEFAPYKDYISARYSLELLENPKLKAEKCSELKAQTDKYYESKEQIENISNFLIKTMEKRKENVLTKDEINNAKAIIPPLQFKTTFNLTKGEEGKYFTDKIKEISQIYENIPKLYETDGLKEHPLALKYFHPSGTEVLICELDKNGEAFGYTIMNGDYEMSEFGYQDLNEIKNIKEMEIDYNLPKDISIERYLYQSSPDNFPNYATYDDELDRYIRLEAERVKFLNEENSEGIEYPEEKENKLLEQLSKVPYDEFIEKMEIQTPAFKEYPVQVLGKDYFSDNREWGYLHDSLYEMLSSHVQKIRQESSAEYLEKCEQKAFLKKNNELFKEKINELNNEIKITETEKKLEDNLLPNQKKEIIEKASSISEKQNNNQNNNEEDNKKGKKY